MQDPANISMRKFVGETRSILATLSGEIALRNKIIQQNDAYVYGDLLTRTLDIPVGHDMTPVNWLRRTVEIHRTQMMGRGFSIVCSFNSLDTDVDDPQTKQMLQAQQKKRKAFAEHRTQLWDAIVRDNNGHALFAQAAENASAVGGTVIEAFYDEDAGKYRLNIVEALEHCYAVWSKDNFRQYDCFAYVYQISKEQAAKQFGVGPNVATSPLGMPLAVLSTANTIEYISTQPMVTVMKVTGKIQGWGSSGNGDINSIHTVDVGTENDMQVTIVGNEVVELIDDPKKVPHYYVLPNKLVRRRPWGIPDISQASVNINQTYIEALSDWRTVASKVNFPKFKYFGFSMGTSLPAPKQRKVEGIPLATGQDIQPLEMPNSAQLGEADFLRQLEELQSQFVREVGISRVLFDTPDMNANSNQAMMTAMKSIGDLVAAKQQLWGPIIAQMATDAINTLAQYDSDVKELANTDDGWYFRCTWPSNNNKSDPVYVTTLINRFNTGTMSVQSLLEHLGETKEEIDRISEEMENPITAAIHGHMLQLLAEFKIAGPPTATPPKVNINLRGDLNPNEVGDIAAERQIVTPQSPFPDILGPQGKMGLTANDNTINQNVLQNPSQKDRAVYRNAQGQQVNVGGPQGNGTNAPQMLNTPGNTQSPMSQPGSGAPGATPQGNLNQQNQRKGR